jgi:hypothetical protein
MLTSIMLRSADTKNCKILSISQLLGCLLVSLMYDGNFGSEWTDALGLVSSACSKLLILLVF